MAIPVVFPAFELISGGQESGTIGEHAPNIDEDCDFTLCRMTGIRHTIRDRPLSFRRFCGTSKRQQDSRNENRREIFPPSDRRCAQNAPDISDCRFNRNQHLVQVVSFSPCHCSCRFTVHLPGRIVEQSVVAREPTPKTPRYLCMSVQPHSIWSFAV